MTFYNKAKRKVIHDQLVAAKKVLWNGKKIVDLYGQTHRFICTAICKTQGVVYYRGIDILAVEVIGDRLDMYGDLGNWLHYCGKVPEEQLTDLAVQTYRHEWLDHLIEEFSK